MFEIGPNMFVKLNQLVKTNLIIIASGFSCFENEKKINKKGSQPIVIQTGNNKKIM